MKKIFITILLLSLFGLSIAQDEKGVTTVYSMISFNEKIGEISGTDVFSEPEKLENSKLEIDTYNSFSTLVLFVNTEMERYYSIVNQNVPVVMGGLEYEVHEALDINDNPVIVLFRKTESILIGVVIIDGSTIENYDIKLIK